jgi:hypothetical protein
MGSPYRIFPRRSFCMSQQLVAVRQTLTVPLSMKAYMFFCLDQNWRSLTHPTYASMLPLPQRYYVPGRIKDSYKPRLEVAGLWNSSPIEPQDEKTETNDKAGFAAAFKREKVWIFLAWISSSHLALRSLRKPNLLLIYMRDSLDRETFSIIIGTEN